MDPCPVKVRSSKDIDAIKDFIPAEDFAFSDFDECSEHQLEKIIVLLSTPRSGSTLVCDLLYKNNICLPHEYFQNYQYMPYFAERWGCYSKGEIDLCCYVKELIKKRTLSSGVLGINLHGSHLPLFDKALPFFPNVPITYIKIQRNDIVAQAVSYEIARQTRSWSSKYTKREDPVYDFNGIKKKLIFIFEQNLLIDSYVQSNDIICKDISYEDFIINPSMIIDIMGLNLNDDFASESKLLKQASGLNKSWVSEFNRQFIENPSLNVELKKSRKNKWWILK